MAITITQVRKSLDDASLKYMQTDETTILTAFGTRDQSLNLVIRLLEDGEYLDLHTVGFATCAADHPNLASLHVELLRQNLTYKLLKFSWDASDGEIRATTSLPIEDNGTLASDQMDALIGALVAGCKEARPEIERLIKDAAPVKRSAAKTAPSTTPQRTAATPEPRAAVASASSAPAKAPVPWALSVGVLLIGLAAILGVIFLFTHKG